MTDITSIFLKKIYIEKQKIHILENIEKEEENNIWNSNEKKKKSIIKSSNIHIDKIKYFIKKSITIVIIF